MASLNPCESLNTFVEGKVKELENYGDQLRDTVESFRDQLKDYVTPPSVESAVNTAIDNADLDDIGAGSTAVQRLQNFTGSCLDKIYNEAREFADNVDGYVSDAIDDITAFASLPEVDLLGPLKNIEVNLGNLGIENLISELDDVLGCLTLQGTGIPECLESIDDFNDRIDTVLDFLGLDADGIFDIDTFVSKFDINIDTGVIDNLKDLSDKVSSMATDAVANVRNNIPSTVNPASRF